MPLFLQAPATARRDRRAVLLGEDEQFDIEHHVRHNALPKPGRVRELLELCGRLHSTRLDWERPLWEAHLIEGLADGRVAMYTKIHHGLVDGISAMRLMQPLLAPTPTSATCPRRGPSATGRPEGGRQGRTAGLESRPAERRRWRAAYGARASPPRPRACPAR